MGGISSKQKYEAVASSEEFGSLQDSEEERKPSKGEKVKSLATRTKQNLNGAGTAKSVQVHLSLFNTTKDQSAAEASELTAMCSSQ